MAEMLKEQIFPSSKKTWILAASLISLGNAFQLMEALQTRDNYQGETQERSNSLPASLLWLWLALRSLQFISGVSCRVSAIAFPKPPAIPSAQDPPYLILY